MGIRTPGRVELFLYIKGFFREALVLRSLLLYNVQPEKESGETGNGCYQI